MQWDTAALPEGNAIIYCEGAFGTPNGKTAHGLVRRTRRYQVLSVVDSRSAGGDAGELLDGRANGIPVLPDVASAVAQADRGEHRATHLVMGLAPDGGRLPPECRRDVFAAIALGLHVDSGLHDYLSEDPELAAAALRHGVTIRDVRKPPPVRELHFFTSKIEQVTSLKVAVLGTDSAVGKRTTAWLLVDALKQAGFSAELVGTGQTAWMQGVRYGLILDAMINDFVSGEIEHAVWSAWHNARPDVIVIEGQGSLMNPAYPGGYEILAAARPDAIVLQHAPARRDYDGFPGYPIQRIERQIEAIEIVSGKRVVAITLNHENLRPEQIEEAKRDLGERTGLPVCDPLTEGLGAVVKTLGQFRRPGEVA